AIRAPPADQSGVRHPRQELREPRVVHVRLPGKARGHLPIARGDLDLLGRGRPAVELLPLRDRLRVVHGHGQELSRRVVEDVEDLTRLGLEADRGDQNDPGQGTGAHRGHLRRRPAADRVAQQVRPPELRRLDEPEIEPREVVDALHPVGIVRAPEAWMGRCPHGEALRDLVEPARPAAVAAGAVEHQQRLARPADPGMYADAADRDRLLTRSHAPYYAPAAYE